MKVLATLAIALMVFTSSMGQEEIEGNRGGFRKENLFAGGSLSLGFSSGMFQGGANPFIGYSLGDWVDAGVVVNFNYASFRDVYAIDDRLRETTYGGGLFTRLYPVRFLFAQAQFERNFIRQKYKSDQFNESENLQANSFLVGAGYTSERYPGSGRPFFYLSVLFDVLDHENSPYTRATGGILPIFRAGMQVPLFRR